MFTRASIADNPSPRAEAVDYNQVEPEDYGSNVDVNYDIGPENYCFVETHNFGAPVLSRGLPAAAAQRGHHRTTRST